MNEQSTTLIWRDGKWVPEDLPELPTDEPEAEKPAAMVWQNNKWVPEETDFSFTETISNVPESAGKALSSAVEGLKEIPQTISNLYVRGRGGTPANPSMDALIDNPGAVLEAPGAIKDYALDRYGSIERFQRSMMEDPVGVTLDLMTAGGLGIKGIQSLGKLGNALATNTYSRLAKFSTVMPWKQREKLIQTALKEGLYPTTSGMKKIEGRLDILNHQIDELISQAQVADELIPVDQIFRFMDDLRSTKGGLRAEATKDLNTINRVEDAFRERFRGENAQVTKVRPAELQAIKKDLYDKAYRKETSRARQGKEPETVKTTAWKEMGRGAKEGIEGVAPETKPINRQLGDLYDLHSPLQQASSRLENRNWLNLMGTILGTGAGAAGGGYLGGAGGAGLGALLSSIALSPMAQRQFIMGAKGVGNLDRLPNVPGLNKAATVGALTMPGRVDEDEDE